MITKATNYPDIKEKINALMSGDYMYDDYYLYWLLEEDHLKNAYVYHDDNKIMDIFTTYYIDKQLIVSTTFMNYDAIELEVKELSEFFQHFILYSEYFDYNRYGFMLCDNKCSFSPGYTYQVRGYYTKDINLVNFFRDRFEKVRFPEYKEEDISYVTIDNYEDLYKTIIQNYDDEFCAPFWRNSSNVSSVAGFHYLQVEPIGYAVNYLIAMIDNMPIGLIKLATESHDNKRQYLCYIDVNEKYQRKGVAKKLISKLSEILDDKPLVLSRESEQGKKAKMAEHFKNAGYKVPVYTEREYEDMIYSKR